MLGKVSIWIEAQMARFESDMGRAARIAEKRTQQMRRAAEANARAMTRSIAGVAAGYIGLQSAAQGFASIVRQSDAYANMSAKIGLVTDSMAEQATAQRRLFDLSQENSSALESSAQLYVRLGQSSEGLRENQALLLDIVDSVSKSLVISGASASEAASATQQFSQAMGSGVLRGEEFNSIMENAPRLAQALADGLGVPVGSLRKLAEQGQLTADVVIKALESQGHTLDREFGEMPLTVGRAVQQVRNSMLQMIGTSDQASGSSGEMAHAIQDLAETLQDPGIQSGFGTIISGMVKVAEYGVRAASAIANFTKQVAQDLAAAIHGIGADDLERQAKLINAKKAMLANIGTGPLDFRSDDEIAAEKARIQSEIDKLTADYLRNAELFGPKVKMITGSNGQGVDEADLRPTGGGGGGVTLPPGRDKEAEQLQRKYEQLSASMREQIALFGQTSEVAKVRYQIEQGELAGLTQAKKDELIADAARIDAMNEEAEVAKRLSAIGDERLDAILQHRQAVAQLANDMQFEIDLTRMSAIEKEKAIALRYANVDAASAEGQAIAGLAEDLYEAREAEMVMQDLKSTVVSFAVEAADNFSSVGDAFENMADRMKRIAIQLLAEKAIQWLVDWMGGYFGGGSTGVGSAGGQSSALAMYGGPRAAGGPVEAGKLYEVGEMGRPELYEANGRTYLIPGNQGGRVVPAAAGSGATVATAAPMGGVTSVVIHNYGGQPVETRESMQGGTRQVEIMIGNIAKKAVGQDIARGGDIGKVIGSRFGLAPAGVPRG